jgi:hypothetical protein
VKLLLTLNEPIVIFKQKEKIRIQKIAIPGRWKMEGKEIFLKTKKSKNYPLRTFRYISFFLIVLSFISYALMLLFSKQYGTTGTTGTTGTIGPFLSTVVWMIIILFLIILTIIIMNLEYFSTIYFFFPKEAALSVFFSKEQPKVISRLQISNIILTSLLILFGIGIFSYFFFFRRNFSNIFFFIIASLTGFNLIAYAFLLISSILSLKIAVKTT